MTTRTIASLLVVSAGLAATSAHAQLVDITQPNTTLASVLGRQFRVGDKIFTMPQNAFISGEFNPAEIFINAVSNADPMTGVGFRLSGAFNDATPGDANVSGFMLSYSVDVAPEFAAQGYRILNGQLRFNGAATGDGSFARVDETMRTAGDMLIGSGNVMASQNGPNVFGFNFPAAVPVTHIDVVKDVRFFAAGAGGTASASFIDQAFAQTVIIPLPTTAGMGMAGLGILAARRRRR